MTRIMLMTAIAITLRGASVPGQNHQPPARPVLEQFPVGEVMRYEGKFGFITLGSAFMEVVGVETIRGTPALHIHFNVQTPSNLYRMNNNMDSWLGLEDFASRRLIQDFDERGKKRYTVYDIFPDSGFYRQNGIDTTMPASPDPLDDASFFYFARTVDLTPGKRYEYNRYFRPDRNPVILEVVERDTIDVPAGRFPVVLIRPIIKGAGILREQSNARIWISDDDRRLIVMMKTNLLGSLSITLNLIKVEGRRDTPPS